jgi:hypothetical protein
VGGRLIKIRGGGDPLPGDGKFGFTLGPVATNATGDTAFIVVAKDLPVPWGLTAGVYRTVFGFLLPVMLPGITRAPDGQPFQGAAFNAHMNSRYDTVFPGLVCSTTPSSVPNPGANPCSTGKLAFGIYRANVLGQIGAVAPPGSPAPGGSTFDYAQVPFINDAGDIAFDAHVFGEACNNPQSTRIFCGESVYLKNARSGAVASIAHQGQLSPAGKKYYLAFGPVLNDFGDLVFIGDLSSAGTGENAVFLYSHGITSTLAKPGDSMPGGGIFSRAGGFPRTAYLNNNLEVAFVGTLQNGDQGLYRWKNGMVTLVAKTGMTIAGIGTIANLDDLGAGSASTQVAINDLGQILFAANLTAGGGALLVANPQ